jgi:hypothetical protein
VGIVATRPQLDERHFDLRSQLMRHVITGFVKFMQDQQKSAVRH